MADADGVGEFVGGGDLVAGPGGGVEVVFDEVFGFVVAGAGGVAASAGDDVDDVFFGEQFEGFADGFAGDVVGVGEFLDGGEFGAGWVASLAEVVADFDGEVGVSAVPPGHDLLLVAEVGVSVEAEYGADGADDGDGGVVGGDAECGAGGVDDGDDEGEGAEDFQRGFSLASVAQTLWARPGAGRTTQAVSSVLKIEHQQTLQVVRGARWVSALRPEWVSMVIRSSACGGCGSIG